MAAYHRSKRKCSAALTQTLQLKVHEVDYTSQASTYLPARSCEHLWSARQVLSAAVSGSSACICLLLTPRVSCLPLQIAALMERCKRLEEEAAEKGRTADALRRKLAFNGAGSLASGPASVASYGSAAGPAGVGAAVNRPGSAASYSSFAAGSGNPNGSLRAARPASPALAATDAYGSTAAAYTYQQAYAGSPRAVILSGGVGAGIGSYSGSVGYHSPTKASAGTLGNGLLGAHSPGGSSSCSAGGVAALRRSWAAGSPAGFGM